MKHTPGKWTTSRHEDTNVHVVRGEQNEIIADCQEVNYSDMITPGEAEANAYLIAAAPELLEACKLVLGCVNSNSITEQIDNEDAEKLSDILAGVYKAIMKAEGKP